MNRTKIVATVGPASVARETLRGMMHAGMNVARINMSHIDIEGAREIIKRIRSLNDELDLNTAVLVDFQGPKLRLSTVAPGTVLVTGETIELTTENVEGNAHKVQVCYDAFARDVAVGERILLDDGKLELEVLATNFKDLVTAKVIMGGALSSRKGVNVPDTSISMASLTEKDHKDLEGVLDCEPEWVGLSFVRRAEDIRDLKGLVTQSGRLSKIVAKIEKPEALAVLDEVIEVSDAVMIARGDLGVEIPMEQVPIVQKEIARKARMASKPVIIATQMMESMIECSRPTRAEANDVANSVLDGADALMLSGETSLGMHPIQTVAAMSKIIAATESSAVGYLSSPPQKGRTQDRFIADGICYHACEMAEKMQAKAVLCMTYSGYAGIKISSYRPDANIFVFTPNRSILNMLSLVWGIQAFYYDGFESTDRTVGDVQQILKRKGLVESGDVVVNTASMPITKKGRTNVLKIARVE